MKKIMFAFLLLIVQPLFAANLSGLASIARDSTYQGRVQVALYTAASVVASEGAGVANHANRLVYASKVLNGNTNIFQLGLIVLTDATISTNANVATTPDFAIADTDIQTFITNNYNKLAAL